MQGSLAELLVKLDEKQRLFTEMLNISRNQLQLLEKGWHENTLSRLEILVSQREQLMDQIDQLTDKELEGRFTQDQTYINRADAIRSIILSIQANDSKCRQAAQVILTRMENKLVSARKNKKAFQAYTTANTYPDAWFFDKKK